MNLKEKRVEEILKEIGGVSLKLIQKSKGHVKLSSEEEFDAYALINRLARQAHDTLSGKPDAN